MKLQAEQQEKMLNSNEYDFPMSLLAGMLEVELTEGNEALNSECGLLLKKPRKRPTSKAHSQLIKQKNDKRAKYEQIKRNDLKLKEACSVVIDSLDLSHPVIQDAFERFYEQGQEHHVSDESTELQNIDNKDDLDELDHFGGGVEIMKLLEVTMEVNDEDGSVPGIEVPSVDNFKEC